MFKMRVPGWVVSPGKLLLIGMATMFLSGCAADMCKSSVKNLMDPPKIPDTAIIKITGVGKIKADAGGQKLLQDHVKMVNQVKSIKTNCKD